MTDKQLTFVVFLQILRLLEEPDYWLKIQRERDEFLKGTTSLGEIDPSRQDESVISETVIIDDF